MDREFDLWVKVVATSALVSVPEQVRSIQDTPFELRVPHLAWLKPEGRHKCYVDDQFVLTYEGLSERGLNVVSVAKGSNGGRDSIEAGQLIRFEEEALKPPSGPVSLRVEAAAVPAGMLPRLCPSRARIEDGEGQFRAVLRTAGEAESSAKLTGKDLAIAVDFPPGQAALRPEVANRSGADNPRAGCENVCEIECQSSCQYVCEDCEGHCQTTCQWSCQVGCEVHCESPCRTSCEHPCRADCQTSCEYVCEVCQTSCETACELACQTGCEVSCQSPCQTGGTET